MLLTTTMTDFQSNNSDPFNRLVDYTTYRDNRIIDRVDQLQSCVKFNPNSNKTAISSCFKKDVVCYLDFADPNNLGYDYSMYGNHLSNSYGVTQSTDSVRGLGANFKRHVNQPENTAYTNLPCLVNDKICPLMKTEEYTIAFWFKANVQTDADQQHVLDFKDTFVRDRRRIRILYVASQNSLHFRGANANGTEVNAITATGTSSSTYNHYAFTISKTGTKAYLNGTVIASNATYVNMSSMSFNAFTIGGAREYCNRIQLEKRGERHYSSLNANLGDFIIFNRPLSDTEVQKLYSDDYGSDIIIFGGQSNMKGYDNLPADLNYGPLSKVYQYETYNNIDLVNYAYTNHTISQLQSGGLFHPEVSGSTCMGMFHTFLSDYVKYVKMPARRRILCVPVALSASAFGGTAGDANYATHLVNTGKLYKTTVLSVNDCMAINSMNTIRAYLWNQGESDCVARNTNYQTNFDDMINGFVRDIPGFSKDVPIIAGEVGSHPYESYYDVTSTIVIKKLINDFFQNMANTKQNYGFVRSYDLYMTDMTHYSVDAFRILGVRYFDQFLKCCGVVSTKPTNQKLIVSPYENVQVDTDLSLKPINKIGWTDATLSGFGNRTLTLPCTLVYTGNVVFKFVKLGSLVLLKLKDTITFTTASSNLIKIVAGGLPSELIPIEDSTTVANGLAVSTLTPIDWEFLQTGEINIRLSGTGNFANATSYTLYPFTMVYESKNAFV